MDNFFQWLNTLPIWFQMIFVSLIVFLSLYLIMSLIKKGFSFTSKGGLKIGGEKIATKLLDLLSERFEIKYYRIMRQQMNYAEEKLSQSKSIAQKTYLALLRKKGVKDLIASNSYQVYRLILIAIKKEILDLIRFNFRENNFAEMSESEFNEYADSKVNSITSLSSDLMNDHYFFTEKITREELYDENMKTIGKHKEYIREIYQNARKVALASSENLEKIDEELKTLC